MPWLQPNASPCSVQGEASWQANAPHTPVVAVGGVGESHHPCTRVSILPELAQVAAEDTRADDQQIMRGRGVSSATGSSCQRNHAHASSATGEDAGSRREGTAAAAAACAAERQALRRALLLLVDTKGPGSAAALHTAGPLAQAQVR